MSGGPLPRVVMEGPPVRLNWPNREDSVRLLQTVRIDITQISKVALVVCRYGHVEFSDRVPRILNPYQARNGLSCRMKAGRLEVARDNVSLVRIQRWLVVFDRGNETFILRAVKTKIKRTGRAELVGDIESSRQRCNNKDRDQTTKSITR